MNFKKSAFQLLAISIFLGLNACGSSMVDTAPVGGVVTGLNSGNSVQLLNNGSDSLLVTANGSFTFNQQLQANSTYNVTIGTQPVGQTCQVNAGTGTMRSDGSSVNNITVNCINSSLANSYLFVQTTGLTSNQTVILNNNGNDALTITQNATIAFAKPLTVGSVYNVILQSDSTGKCRLSSSYGVIPNQGSAPPVMLNC